MTIDNSDMVDAPIIYSCRVLRFKKFLPKGKTEGGGYRPQDLVQLWTDPGGMRTLAVNSIRMGRKRKPIPRTSTT